MKSASLPSLRVDPELRQAAERVLREGESLSNFMDARGLAAREQARRTGTYYGATAVHDELRAMLATTGKHPAKR